MKITHCLEFALACGLCSLDGETFHNTITDEPSKESIKQIIVWESRQAGLDPDFVTAICFAESNFQYLADSGFARGLMQVSKAAWQQVRDDDWSLAWDWRENIRAGVSYLAWCKDYLQRHGTFNYPNLAACYRFGPYAVKKSGFKVAKLPRCSNKTYQGLFKNEKASVLLRRLKAT